MCSGYAEARTIHPPLPHLAPVTRSDEYAARTQSSSKPSPTLPSVVCLVASRRTVGACFRGGLSKDEAAAAVTPWIPW